SVSLVFPGRCRSVSGIYQVAGGWSIGFTFSCKGTTVTFVRWIPAVAVALLLLGSGPAQSDTDKKAAKEGSSFGAIKGADAAEAQKQAEAWLKGVKNDAATLAKFRTIWASDRSVADRVADTLALGDAQAAKLLADARDADTPAPTEVPALLKDKKKP